MALYASRAYNGLPCSDARARCRKAVEIARKLNAKIVIASEMYNPDPLCEAMHGYLLSLGFPADRILKNPKGVGTIAETGAIAQAIQRDGGGTITAVSAWYHIPRVRLIWKIFEQRNVRTRCSWRAYPWHNPLRELFAWAKLFLTLSVKKH